MIYGVDERCCSIGLIIYRQVCVMHVCFYSERLGTRVLELLLRRFRCLLCGLWTPMGCHWFCGRVIISVVVNRDKQIGFVTFTNDETYTFMACSKYPPPPEVVIVG
jgi:hypothetical protein